MILYFLKSGLCLALLLFFYHQFMEREKMHSFNRWYLMGSLFFSILVPFIVLPAEWGAEHVVMSASGLKEIADLKEQPSLFAQALSYIKSYSFLFVCIYGTITTLLFIRFCRNLYGLSQRIRLNERTPHSGMKLVLVPDRIVPHSFFNFIFIDKKAYRQNEIEPEILTHEMAHARQKHSLDILLVETAHIIFWLNPFIPFLKRAIRTNHEFLADQRVVLIHKNIIYYQQLLLNRATKGAGTPLASSFNFSLIKKRLIMMTNKKSGPWVLLKKLAVIPLLALLVFLFANKMSAQKGVSETLLTEYRTIAKKENKANKDLERLRDIYVQMSETQRKSVAPLTEVNHDDDREHGDEGKETAGHHQDEAEEHAEHHKEVHTRGHKRAHEEGEHHEHSMDGDEGHDEHSHKEKHKKKEKKKKKERKELKKKMKKEHKQHKKSKVHSGERH